MNQAASSLNGLDGFYVDEFIKLYGRKNYFTYFGLFIYLCEKYGLAVVRYFCENYGPEHLEDFENLYMGRHYSFSQFVYTQLKINTPEFLTKNINWYKMCLTYQKYYLYDYNSLAVFKKNEVNENV